MNTSRNDLETLVSLHMIVGTSPPKSQAPSGEQASVSTGAKGSRNSEAATPASRVVSPAELKILIRRATRQLENLLGPSCEPLNLKLEKSKTYDEFAIKIYDTRHVLVSTCSETIADEFIESALV